MDEEIGAGVKILIERAKTNPQEIIEEYGRWGQLRDAVFIYKERKERSTWLRGLTEHEIDQLHEAFSVLYKDVFDSWVMKTVLEDEDAQTASQSGLRYKATERYVQGFTDPRMYQNAIQPGTMITVSGGGSGGSGGSGGGGGGSITTTASIQTSTAQRAEQLGLGHLLKKKLRL